MAQPPADPDRALPRTYPGDSAPTHEDGAPAGDDDDLEDDDDQQEIYGEPQRTLPHRARVPGAS